MKSKGILIIGGGILQSYAISKARKRGYIIHLTDGSNNCYSRNFADYFYNVDTKDYKSTSDLSIMLKNQGNIDAVYTQGTDVAFTVAYAAKKAGMVGLDPEIAWSTENKIEMRKKLFNSGIDKTQFLVIENEDELLDCEQKIGFPCYVKPADNSGSRGITRVDKASDLNFAYKNAINNCLLENMVLIEEEIVGNEYSIDTIVINKTLYNAGISDRIFNKKNKYAVQSGSITPSLLSEDTQFKMIDIMSQIANEFDINNSALKGDLIIDKNGEIKVIEIAARTSGGFDSQVRKPTSFGMDIISLTQDLSFGNDIDFSHLIPKWIKWSKTMSIFPNPGIVSKIIGDNWISRNNNVVDYKLLIKEGETVNTYNDCSKRTNYITFKANTYDGLKAREKTILDNFIIQT